MSNRKRIGIALAALILSLAISFCAVLDNAVTQKRRRVERAGYVISSEISKLQFALDYRILDTEILEMILIDGNGVINNFNRTAQMLYNNDPAIRSLQLAPGGVVTDVYPLTGNENAFVDLFHDPQRKTEAEYARDTGELTLAGPFALYQGGMGLVARNPIYLQREDGENTFWGFSIVVLNVPQIFDGTGLENLARQGYAYRLWRIHPDTGSVQVIIESTDSAIRNPVTADVAVPNGVWTLSIAPQNGWYSRQDILIDTIMGIVVSVLVTLVVYAFLTVEKQKRKLCMQANTDPLTGICNERALASALKTLVQDQVPFALFFLDLDKFKQVNDAYGHDVGDGLLCEAALRMRQCIRDTDGAYRVGGDEFAVIIRGTHPAEFFAQMKNRLQETIGQPCQIGSILLHPRASCGYARYPEDQTTEEALLKQADQNMYLEKKQSHADFHRL